MTKSQVGMTKIKCGKVVAYSVANSKLQILIQIEKNPNISATEHHRNIFDSQVKKAYDHSFHPKKIELNYLMWSTSYKVFKKCGQKWPIFLKTL